MGQEEERSPTQRNAKNCFKKKQKKTKQNKIKKLEKLDDVKKIGQKNSLFDFLLEDNKSFHNGRQGDVIFGGQFSSLTMSEKDGRRVRLEASDGLGFTSLANHVDGLSNAHRNRQRP